MARILKDSEIGSRALLFDRLVDQAPERVESRPYRYYSLPELRSSVMREVTRLLNTRRPVELALDDPSGTILTYGLSDHAMDTVTSVPDQESIRQEMIRVIETYEPRLRHVTVSLLGSNRGTQRVTFQVDGLLVAGRIREQFSFPIVVGTEEEEG